MATAIGGRWRAHRGRIGVLAGQGVMHVVLIIVTFASLMPFIWMALASFKAFPELVSSKALLPKVWTLKNYAEIINRVGFIPGFRNSVVSAIPVTAMTVLTSTAVGFVFAKYRFWKKELFFTIILSTMMVPFTVVLIPLYVTIADFRMVNTLWGIIVTGFWSTFGIFMLRQAIEGIPSDYLDAARIDGASEVWIFGQVIIPLSTSAMSALAVFTFLGNWDSFMWPSIVLTSPNTQTLPLVLAGLRNLYWERYDLWTAGSMLTVIPVMICYSVAQRQFIQGITMTGLKG